MNLYAAISKHGVFLSSNREHDKLLEHKDRKSYLYYHPRLDFVSK